MTKPVDAGKLQWHIERSGAVASRDRHELMPEADYCKEIDEDGIDGDEEE